MFNRIRNRIKHHKFYKQWMKQNGHNDILPVRDFPLEVVQVGKCSYGDLKVITFNTKSHLIIGNYVSIAPEVTFLLDVEHRLDTVSTFPFRKLVLGLEDEAFSKGDILVDDDVWIGYGATILSGVHIGQGAVIAAGALVTKDVEPYAIVGGVPAKTIRYRFGEERRKELLYVNYSKLDTAFVREHIEELYKEVKTTEDIAFLPKRSD